MREPNSTSHFLPKVSIIVINYNYETYLERCLQSVASQTFRNTEIIVIDDKSTDASWRLITELTEDRGQYAGVKAFQTPKNGGHGVAAAFGFEKSVGSYIIFVDADDILLPTCVQSHIYAHLSSRIPVGFSSVDAYCMSGNEMVTSTYGSARAAYVASNKGQLANMIRPIDEVSAENWQGITKAPLTSNDMHFVSPAECEWVWTPMSGNCFRRDAVGLFLHGPEMADIRSGLDTYLMRPISAISGSLLIDRPLFGYRIHRENVFIKSPPLAGFICYNDRLETDNASKTAVRKTFELIATRGNIFEQPELFFEAVASQCRHWPGLKADHGDGDFLAECLLKYRCVLTREFGSELVMLWLERINIRECTNGARKNTGLGKRLWDWGQAIRLNGAKNRN